MPETHDRHCTPRPGMPQPSTGSGLANYRTGLPSHEHHSMQLQFGSAVRYLRFCREARRVAGDLRAHPHNAGGEEDKGRGRPTSGGHGGGGGKEESARAGEREGEAKNDGGVHAAREAEAVAVRICNIPRALIGRNSSKLAAIYI